MKQNCPIQCHIIIKSAYLLVMFLLTIGILSACNTQSSNKVEQVESQASSESAKEQSIYPLTLKDEVGNEVTLPLSLLKFCTCHGGFITSSWYQAYYAMV